MKSLSTPSPVSIVHEAAKDGMVWHDLVVLPQKALRSDKYFHTIRLNVRSPPPATPTITLETRSITRQLGGKGDWMLEDDPSERLFNYRPDIRKTIGVIRIGCVGGQVVGFVES